MTAMTSHEEVADLLPGAALDALDAAEAQAVFRHIESCPACARELAEYQETVAGLGLLLDAPSLKHVRIDTLWQQPKQAAVIWFKSGE